MTKNQKKNTLIIVGVSLGIGVLCFIFFWLLPTLFQKWISEETIEAFLAHKAGSRGLIYLALIQAAQVLSIFFPGAAVQIAGGLVYGTLRSFLVCLASFVGANVGVFALARRRKDLMSNPNSKRSRKMQKVLDWINSSDPFFMTLEEAQQESSRCLRCDHFGYGIFKGGRVEKW
jgi:Uncharacterized conserved protein